MSDSFSGWNMCKCKRPFPQQTFWTCRSRRNTVGINDTNNGFISTLRPLPGLYTAIINVISSYKSFSCFKCHPWERPVNVQTIHTLISHSFNDWSHKNQDNNPSAAPALQGQTRVKANLLWQPSKWRRPSSLIMNLTEQRKESCPAFFLWFLCRKRCLNHVINHHSYRCQGQ